jgi:pimeloyl-ACP methyl ester carboxylesterase
MDGESELEPEAQKRLDDLVAGFEEDMRTRPTPDELGEDADDLPKARRKRAARSKTPETVAGAPEGGAATDASVVEETTAPAAEAQPVAPTETQPPAAPPAPQSAAPVPEPTLPLLTPTPPVSAPAAPAATTVPPTTLPHGDIESWWAKGERLRVDVPGRDGAPVQWEIFTRVIGSGPWLTLIHGFPTSSWDWAPVADALARKHRLLMFDLLGFGESDKPAGRDWSTFEQADIVEALWGHFRVDRTRVLAHDVGDTVTLELLAREGEGRLGARLAGVTLLNGGIYTGVHRPRAVQVWLQRPVIGALIARMLSERRFGTALAEVFGANHQPSPEELHQHWLSVARRNGSQNYHRLIKYIPERRANAARWEAALERAKTPMKFVWGMADPVSGAHMAEVIKERRPGADIVELPDVGHYPQVEAPANVISAVLEGQPKR